MTFSVILSFLRPFCVIKKLTTNLDFCFGKGIESGREIDGLKLVKRFLVGLTEEVYFVISY